MIGALNHPMMEELLLRYEVEKFFNHEAELLDSRKFEIWLDLLTEDIRYWMPLSRNQEFGGWEKQYTREGKDLNWFDESKFELEQRVKQIKTGLHWAEEPVSRTCHMISNLQVVDGGDGSVETRWRFFVYRNRTETETDFFVGKRHDTLKRSADSFKIAAREIYLDQSVLLAKNLTIFF